VIPSKIATVTDNHYSAVTCSFSSENYKPDA